MKKINIRRVTLASLLGLCFWVALERVHDFYVENIPIGDVGSCYDIRYPDFKGHYQMRIVRNSFESKESIVTISLLNDSSQNWTDTYTFFETRMLNPKRMDCK